MKPDDEIPGYHDLFLVTIGLVFLILLSAFGNYCNFAKMETRIKYLEAHQVTTISIEQPAPPDSPKQTP